MDDLDDELLDQSEMNDLFSRPIGQDSYMTDADLETGIKHIIFFLFKLSILLRIGRSCRSRILWKFRSYA
jgi:hypothetical protein